MLEKKISYFSVLRRIMCLKTLGELLNSVWVALFYYLKTWLY